MPMRVVRVVRRQGRNHPFLTACVVILAIVIPSLLRMQALNAENHKLSQCVDNWANGYQDRLTSSTAATQDRQNALDALVRTVGGTTNPQVFIDLRTYILAPSSEAKRALHTLVTDSALTNKPFSDALHRYIKASDHYNKVSAKFPVNKLAQKLNC